MHEKIRWTLPPFKKHVAVLTAGINAFFEASELPHKDSLRLQVSLEGVFSYCAANIWHGVDLEQIEVTMSADNDLITLMIRHQGGRGEWDDALSKDSDQRIKRTSFENMGLFIANEILETLTHEKQFDLTDGKQYHKYDLTYRIGSGESD